MYSDKVLTGIKRAEYIYLNRSEEIFKIKQQGKKVIAYFCCYPPLELLTSSGLVPVRILGDIKEPITEGGKHLPPIMCNYIRSCLDCKQKNNYDYSDGVIGCHSCDGIERTSHIWSNLAKPESFSFFLDIPHTLNKNAVDFFVLQLKYMKNALEQFTGTKISSEKLLKEIELHNKTRKLVRVLYDMRKLDPPKISGSDLLKVLVAVMTVPVEEGNALLIEVIKEVNNLNTAKIGKKPRLLIWGSIIDNFEMIQLIESSGADVVIDDSAIGTRSYWHDVKLDDDPINAIADRYLVKVECPCSFKEAKKTFNADNENRFGYINELIKDWKVDGAVLYIIRNCDPHGFEIPAIKSYFESRGIRTIILEHDYTNSSIPPLKTRMDAFIEMFE